MKISPRVSRYDGNWSDQELDRIIVRPAPQIILGREAPETDAQTLVKAMEKIFVSSPQIRRILRHLVRIARAHALQHFVTDAQYLAKFHSEYPWGEGTGFVTFLTSLAGVGKTELLGALSRLLLESMSTIDVPGISNIPLVPLWSFSANKGVGLNDILAPQIRRARGEEERVIVPGEIPKRIKDRKLRELMQLGRSLSWRDAACLFTVDEFQAITHSENASAKSAALLKLLSQIGPLLIVAANFSLGHKLKRRPDEECQRLLARPIILVPEQIGSPAWRAHLSAIKDAAPEVFVFSVDDADEEVHRFTYGRKRPVTDLMAIAYRLGRKKNRQGKVGMDEIRLAQRSFEFSNHRATADILIRQDTNKKMEREDLWCPFDIDAPSALDDSMPAPKSAEASPTATSAQKITDQKTRDVIDAGMRSAMTPSEARAHDEIISGQQGASGRSKVVPIRRKASSRDELAKGARALIDSLA